MTFAENGSMKKFFSILAISLADIPKKHTKKKKQTVIKRKSQLYPLIRENFSFT